MSVMIVALEPKEFIPCGQTACQNHPGVICLHFNQSQDAGTSLLGTLSQVTLDDKPKGDVSWKLRVYKDVEEELYLSGHTVVWSRGQTVFKTFTVDSIVKQVAWSSFVVSGEDPCKFELPQVKPTPYKSVDGVAMVTEDAVHVFTGDGDNFVTALPFKVRDFWNFKFGLLFERKREVVENNRANISAFQNSVMENDLTTIFCLQHPLREFSPVITKTQGTVRYMSRPHDSIVFCEDDFILTCDKRHGLHTVWRARAVSSNDVNVLQSSRVPMQNHMSSICHMSMSSPGISPFRGSFRGSPGFHGNSHSGAQQPGLNKTPHTSRNPTIAHLSYTPHSSRAFSPSATGSLMYQNHTFSPLRHSPHLTRSPCTPVSHESLCLNNSVHETAEPLQPEICFDHMWTEAVTCTREGLSVGCATKVFLTRDLCDQSYLVYHLDSQSQLRVVRYSRSNNMTHLIFGAVTCIQARDAGPLHDLRMHAVIDLSGSLILYTGIIKVVKVNLSGLPMASLSLSHGLRNTASVSATPQPISTPAHPSRPTSAMATMEEVGLLSPVPELEYTGNDISILTGDEFAFSTSGISSRLIGLPHVVGSTLILEVTGGANYRADVPQLCTSELVNTCMRALQFVLPNDTYLSYATKWYSFRHAPGALNGRNVEWTLFVECLQDFLGYVGISSWRLRHSAIQDSMEFDVSSSPVIAAKKLRHSDQLDAKDWEFMTSSKYNKCMENTNDDDSQSIEDSIVYQGNSHSWSNYRRHSLDSSLAGDSMQASNQPLMSVFSVLHLVYEEQKLNTILWPNVEKMASFLYRLASDLNLPKYCYSYALDCPILMKKFLSSKMHIALDSEEQEIRSLLSSGADQEPHIYANLHQLTRGKPLNCPFPYIPNVTVRIERILKIYNCLFTEGTLAATAVFTPMLKTTFNVSQSGDGSSNGESILKVADKTKEERVLSYMLSVGIDSEELMTWPSGVALPIQLILKKSSENPDLSLPSAALKLLGRADLLSQLQPEVGNWKNAKLCPSTDPMRYTWIDSTSNDEMDEIFTILNEDKQDDELDSQTTDSADDNVTRLLFPSDHRMADAHHLLDSSVPVRLTMTQESGMDDRDFMEQKQLRLLQLLNRSTAQPIGRGMLTFQTQTPSAVRPLQVPLLNLHGKDTSNGTVNITGNTTFEIPPGLTDWPHFHNGVAAALSMQNDQNTQSWVHLNTATSDETNTTKDPSFEHAGTLFGFGLNHHLKELQTLNVHKYLQKTHETTTIGLLLGLASEKCGSCDLSTMRILSVHISALLPPTSTQLPISCTVQASAAAAVGFLYLGSAQRLVADVMLREIDRTPSSETEATFERECYALSAGFALGMVTLGMGNGMAELSDLNISDRLFHLMTGRHKRTGRHVTRSSQDGSPGHTTTTNQILEGDRINMEVTGPAATMALALMYLKTNNEAVSEWFLAPHTISLLETIKPHHLLLRTLTRSLILWDQIQPNKEWIESHIPSVVQSHLRDSETHQHNQQDEVDEQTILQCHASIITGACLALGLRFAGSQEKAAFDTLLHYVNFFISLWKRPGTTMPSHPLEVIGRRLFFTCLTSCLIALCMVVAGSGNLKAMQICRYLHYSVEGDINYGTQMATHMALGFLFLGKCRYTLSTSNKAIASLLVSIYPSFPSKTTDNRYHLQALRHMYVLATEKRMLIPIDVKTQRPCYAHVMFKYSHCDTSTEVMAPCMVPELNVMKSIILDQRHLPLEIDVQKHPDKLKQILEDGLYVQLAPGCLPYIQDPKGDCSFYSPPTERPPPNTLPNILYNISLPEKEEQISRILTLLRNQQNEKDFFLYLSLLEICCHLEGTEMIEPLCTWQIRLAKDFIKSLKNSASSELIDTVSSKVDNVFQTFLIDKKPLIEGILLHKRTHGRYPTRSQVTFDQSHLSACTNSEIHILASYLIYNAICLPIGVSGITPSLNKKKQKKTDDLTNELLKLKQLGELSGSVEAAVQLFFSSAE